MRARRAAGSTDEGAERYQSDPGFATRVRARSRMQQRVSRGTVKRQPCERCGRAKAEMHHDDYESPTVVRWLCTGCHGAEHYPQATAEDNRRAAHERRLAEIVEKYQCR